MPARATPLHAELRRRRRRVALLWTGFAFAVLAAGALVFRLYGAFERELQEQQRLVVEAKRTEARLRVDAEVAALRDATLKRLVGFHVEGLGHALQRWDDSDPEIVGFFQWEAGQFLPGARLPERVKQELLPRAWRALDEEPGSQQSFSPYQTHYIRTVNNPAYPPGSFGYQDENLEIFAYNGGRANPIAGWSVAAEPGLPWAIWYRAGPGAAVRGCFVDLAPLLARLRAEFAREPTVEIELFSHLRSELPEGVRPDRPLEPGLPGCFLAVRPGRLFTDKMVSAQLGALGVALLLGVVGLGIGALWWISRREIREAEQKATFVTQVSHELRTPLTSIRMFADMLAAPEIAAEKRAKFAGTISRESARLGALIDRLLTFTALEKGKQAAIIAAVDVAGVGRETLDEMDATLRAGGLRVETQWPDGPLLALADRATVKQALLNLLDNALKYAREGRVIRVAAAAGRGGVRVRVADDGPGIPRALRTRIFAPFVQGTDALTDKPPGVGLGLSIARGLLRNAGGDLVLLPSDRGAVFEIQLPPAPPA